MLKKIAIAVVVLIVAAIVLVATRPGSFHVERSAQIGAPPTEVFAIVNDFRHWHDWSPYDKRDPNMKMTFEGPPSGPGSVYAWSGNDDVGEGRMTLVESKPNELVTMDLEFTRPFPCKNLVTFKLVPSEGGTRVTWNLDGKNDFMAKAFSLFMNMDTMVGKDFEQGLSNLDALAKADKHESGHAADDVPAGGNENSQQEAAE